MRAHDMVQALTTELENAGWSDIDVEPHAEEVRARARRGELPLTIRCPRVQRFTLLSNIQPAECASIVAEAGDPTAPHERWALWHPEHPCWSDDASEARKRPTCPVAVAIGPGRVTVSTFGRVHTTRDDVPRGPKLTYASVLEAVRVIDALTSSDKQERAAALTRLDPDWTSSRWPTHRWSIRKHPAMYGAGTVAGSGLVAAGVAAATGALPVAAILGATMILPGLYLGIVAASKAVEVKPSAFMNRELRRILRSSSLLDHVGRPFVAETVSLPLLVSGVAFFVLAVRSCVQATGRKHQVRVRISHWQLRAEADGISTAHPLPPSWISFEILAPAKLIERSNTDPTTRADDSLQWLATDDESAARALTRALACLQNAASRRDHGPYR